MFSLGFLGGGQMAEAILGGLHENASDLDLEFLLYDPERMRRLFFQQQYGATIAEHNAEVVEKASVLFLAVKPQVFPEVEDVLSKNYREGQIIVSIMAGVTMETIGEKIPHAKIIRLMPNTAMAVGAGACLFTANEQVTEKEQDWVKSLLSRLGTVTVLKEAQMNAATAISGSGPAFFYAMIESLVLGGIEVGLPKKTALDLANQTMYGAAKMLKETQKEPTVLRDSVLSPGGTTVEGLRVLENRGFTAALMEAVAATKEKGEQLGKRKDETK